MASLSLYIKREKICTIGTIILHQDSCQIPAWKKLAPDVGVRLTVEHMTEVSAIGYRQNVTEYLSEVLRLKELHTVFIRRYISKKKEFS